ncbi:MAG TPA: ribonuclease III [Pyrinomonadaceae bacterium]|jgi:ribonuclease-3|nr:ribonuclease III [Pyrinomonadaceae bacterium]
MSAKVGKLENLVGHKFKDIRLLEQALTHRSWAFENLPPDDAEAIHASENESMEFLGDSVLGLVIAEQVYSAHPEHDEGGLTLMKHHLVSTATLATIAETMDLGAFIRVGRGEEKTGGRKKQALLANSLEAVIGAVFLDGGYTAARVFITRIFGDELKTATPTNSLDYKTLLQEILQADKQQAPSYNVVKTDGPPHAREFTVEAVWDGGRTVGHGTSIKAAEMMAAADAVETLKPRRAKRGESK